MNKIIAQTPVQIAQDIAVMLEGEIQHGTLTFPKQQELIGSIIHLLDKKVIETLIRKMASIGADKALYAVVWYARNIGLEFDINSSGSNGQTAYLLAFRRSHTNTLSALSCFGVSTESLDEYGPAATSLARYPGILAVYEQLSDRPFTKIILIGPGLMWVSPTSLKADNGNPLTMFRLFSQKNLNEFRDVKNIESEVTMWADVLPFYFPIFPNAAVIVLDRPELCEIVLKSQMVIKSGMREEVLGLFLQNLSSGSSPSAVESFQRFCIASKIPGLPNRESVHVEPKDLYEYILEFRSELPQSFSVVPVASEDCSLMIALNVLQYPALRCQYESENIQCDLDKILLSLFHSMGDPGQDVLIVTKDSLSPYMGPGGLLLSVIEKGIVSLDEFSDGSKKNHERLIVLKLKSSKALSEISSCFFSLYPALKS